MQENTGKQTQKEISLEELDVLCRKCHHLHDEEVLLIMARFFKKIVHIFKHEKHQHCHSSAK